MDTQPNDGNADQRCPNTSLYDVRLRLSALRTKMAVLQEWLVALRREAAPLALQVALEDERALRGHAREARTKKIVEEIPVVQAQTPVAQAQASPSLSGRWNMPPVVAEVVTHRLVFSKPLPEDRSRGQ